MGDKLFKTYREQIEILRSRGLKVDKGAIGVLQTENYYNVINGYKDLFLEIASPEEKFKDGADFDEIYALYEFDRELRFIFLKQLLKLETNIKSVTAYKFSEKYGHGMDVQDIFKVEHFQVIISGKNLLSGKPVADPFVIAKAKIIDGTVITNEANKPNGAKIPNICERFNVKCINLEQFMEVEGWSF
ncbi:DUF4411 family protein [Petroclostridium xylanilyticum]|uniref:DUF4411 family protein n=1 Tax=Petroclostridium xylanilyticum TaxID=1792311 RepID=UPI000B997A1D|nr:DUF4411 family protein [Petroclostridium xylanilyticum]